MKNRNTNVILSIIVTVFLFLSMVQDLTGLFPMPSLKGAIAEVKKDNFSFDSWFSGDFQKNREEYTQANFDFRKVFVRLNNQFNYSFFGKASSPKYFIGKDNYLFSEDVLHNYLGEGAMVSDSIRMHLEKLKFVQDTLQKLNTRLVFIIAPAKASTCLDKIPTSMWKDKKQNNNYDFFVKHAKELKIDFIDYNAYFKQWRKTTTFPLFPPKGVHWSIYSTTYVIDSLSRYIEFHQKTKLATYNWSKTEYLEAKGSDVDVENVFNLMSTIDTPKLPYRRLIIQKRNNDSLKVLAIGDSFYGELFANGMKHVLPPTNEFWFYGRVSKSLDSNTANDLHFYQLNFKEKIKESDVIMLIYNESNLGPVGYVMIDRLYRLFTNQSLVLPVDEEFSEHVKERIVAFQKDDNRMGEIKELALLKKITVDSMLEVNATMSVEYDIWNGKIALKKR